jgi:hypothetical protein
VEGEGSINRNKLTARLRFLEEGIELLLDLTAENNTLSGTARGAGRSVEIRLHRFAPDFSDFSGFVNDSEFVRKGSLSWLLLITAGDLGS